MGEERKLQNFTPIEKKTFALSYDTRLDSNYDQDQALCVCLQAQAELNWRKEKDLGLSYQKGIVSEYHLSSNTLGDLL